MEKKLWYAVLTDKEDNDWGTGSFDFDQACEMANDRDYDLIVAIDGNYDEDGNETSDAICVAEYKKNDDMEWEEE